MSIQMPKPPSVQFIDYQGGLDLESPPLEAAPGDLQDSVNFDIGTTGGYNRIQGYELYDGTQLAIEYGFYSVSMTFDTPNVVLNRPVTCLATGATGTVIHFDSTYLYYVMPSGTFRPGDQLSIDGVIIGNALEEPYQRKDRSTYTGALCMKLSADIYRAAIGVVPGNGPIRGLSYLNGVLYAFRNTADSSACAIYKASGTGWQLVTLPDQIAFTGGSGNLVEGTTLTKGAVSALIKRVVVESGSLAGGTAAGKLIIGTVTGGTFSAGAATAPGATLTLSGAKTAVTLNPNGRFRFQLYNFGAGLRMYGAYGTGQAFEFDGTVLVPIKTGMTVDTPSHIATHKNHLFLSFDNSLQHSGIGNPYVWSAVLGAAELNMGEKITNLLPQPSDSGSGGAMAVSTRNSLYVLYGTSSANWNLVTLQKDVGSFAHTMQQIAATSFFLDDRGVSSLNSVKEFGNFASATVSRKVRSWLMERKTDALDSCVVKEKNQMRLFFAGGIGMHITFDGVNPTGFMPVQYGHSVCIALSTELADGTDATFYGDDSGRVFLADKGPSFAGTIITAFFKTHYNHCKSPRVIKRFRKITFEVKGAGYSAFAVGSELGYGTYDLAANPIDTAAVEFAGPRWDNPGSTWDSGVWDGRVLLPVEVPIEGSAENLSVTVYQSSDKYESLQFQGALLQYQPRRIQR